MTMSTTRLHFHIPSPKNNMSYSLNSLKGVDYSGHYIIWGSIIGVAKGDARSLDYKRIVMKYHF